MVGTVGSGPVALLLASHLDTSLSGSPADDAAITGRSDPLPALRVDGATVAGFGLGVARGPAAAAVSGFLLAAAGRPRRPLQLLLASAGTHRSALDGPVAAQGVHPASSQGALAHLATGPRPDAVVIAKCGPPAVLRAEPGACYLRLRVSGGWGAALAPASATPAGGILTSTGTILAAVARWREAYVAARRGRADGIGGEAGIGALHAGSSQKPDLLPAVVDLRLYVVTVPGDDPAALAVSLEEEVAAALPGIAVDVTAETLHAAGVTPADRPVVVAAVDAWTRHCGGPPTEVRDWTGSTDGVVFRGAGIDTVRLGPTSSPDPDDPRVDRLDLRRLDAFRDAYAEIALRACERHTQAGSTTGRDQPRVELGAGEDPDVIHMGHATGWRPQ